MEYSNYIDSQKRISNQLSAQIPSIHQNLNATEEKTSSIVLDAKVTFENDYARLHSFQIVEALPGMSIEQVAKDVCGKRYMG